MCDRRGQLSKSRHAGDMREVRQRLMQFFLGLFCANRLGYVAGDAAVTEETSFSIKNGLAAHGNVPHRAIRPRGPVLEVAKWRVLLEVGKVKAPLLRLLPEVGGECPWHKTDLGGDGPAFLGDTAETVVRTGFPKPVGGRLGVIAEALLAFPPFQF